MWNCLWGHALKRSPWIIHKNRVLYLGPGFLSSATWPLAYNGLINQSIWRQGRAMAPWCSRFYWRRITTWSSHGPCTTWSTQCSPLCRGQTVTTPGTRTNAGTTSPTTPACCDPTTATPPARSFFCEFGENSQYIRDTTLYLGYRIISGIQNISVTTLYLGYKIILGIHNIVFHTIF